SALRAIARLGLRIRSEGSLAVFLCSRRDVCKVERVQGVDFGLALGAVLIRGGVELGAGGAGQNAMRDSADFHLASIEPPKSLAFDQAFDVVVRRLADTGGDYPSMGAHPSRGHREGLRNRQRSDEVHRLAVGGSLEQGGGEDLPN